MEELNSLRKSSNRSAIVSLIGLMIVIASLLFASYNLYKTTKSYEKLKYEMKVMNDSLNIERQKIEALKHDELELNQYLINLLNSTQANQGNPLRQISRINWDAIKRTITELPSGKRKLAITIALLTTWKEIPFKLGINKPREGYDSPGYLQYILKQTGIDIEPKNGEKLSEAIMRCFKKVENPLPGDLIFYRASGRGEIGNFGLLYLCPGDKSGKGIAIGTLDSADSLNIYDTAEITNPNAFLGYFRVTY